MEIIFFKEEAFQQLEKKDHTTQRLGKDKFIYKLPAVVLNVKT